LNRVKLPSARDSQFVSTPVFNPKNYAYGEQGTNSSGCTAKSKVKLKSIKAKSMYSFCSGSDGTMKSIEVAFDENEINLL
jgi:hypothetical protein